MSLTIEIEPNNVSPVYNPVIFQFSSDVRSDYTIGAVHIIEAGSNLVNNNGYVEISYDVDHGFVVGDFIKITDDGGLEGLEGVWKVTQIIDSDSYVINAPYTGPEITDVYLYKYLKNYSCIIRIFAYNDCDEDYGLIAKLLFKPLFDDGFCYFKVDVADVLKNYNNECNTDVNDISGDLMPLSGIPAYQRNNKSFLKYYISYAEGFDNPVAQIAQYVETEPEVN